MREVFVSGEPPTSCLITPLSSLFHLRSLHADTRRESPALEEANYSSGSGGSVFFRITRPRKDSKDGGFSRSAPSIHPCIHPCIHPSRDQGCFKAALQRSNQAGSSNLLPHPAFHFLVCSWFRFDALIRPVQLRSSGRRPGSARRLG